MEEGNNKVGVLGLLGPAGMPDATGPAKAKWTEEPREGASTTESRFHVLSASTGQEHARSRPSKPNGPTSIHTTHCQRGSLTAESS